MIHQTREFGSKDQMFIVVVAGQCIPSWTQATSQSLEIQFTDPDKIIISSRVLRSFI